VTREILEAAGLVVAMSTDHQRFLQARFGVRAPLYLEACGGACAPLPDIEEVVLDYRTNIAAVQAHVRLTIDTIIEAAPPFAERVQPELRSSR
jgi:hypothetical protein